MFFSSPFIVPQVISVVPRVLPLSLESSPLFPRALSIIPRVLSIVLRHHSLIRIPLLLVPGDQTHDQSREQQLTVAKLKAATCLQKCSSLHPFPHLPLTMSDFPSDPPQSNDLQNNSFDFPSNLLTVALKPPINLPLHLLALLTRSLLEPLERGLERGEARGKTGKCRLGL